jgi:molecular chaperone DnaK
VISVQEGFIEVVSHSGDKELGGKDLDWAIVDELLIPAVTQQSQVTNFSRKTKKWRGAIAKLKGAVEEAKIQLSTAETAEIDIDFLCQDDQGEPVEFHYSLRRTEVERLAAPLILRSIRICMQALAGKGLGPDTVEKVLLIGGPTRMPYLRKRLEEELKIPLEFRLDPMTSVAKGAAIFGSMQRLEADPVDPSVHGEYGLALRGNPAGPETEPLLGGKVQGQDGEDLRSFTIEFINSTTVPPWRSGKISLEPNGAFMLNLWAEAGRINRFDIHLSDATGRLCKTTPTHWQYEVVLHGIAGQPMITTIGVGLVNNAFRRYIEKGASLPARKLHRLATAFPVTKGQRDPLLCVPVFEGEYSRADRNRRIGELKVSADKLTRDLPAGMDVEVTITVDTSRLVQVRAWIPILDEEFHCRLELGGPTILLPAEQLTLQVRHEKKRLDELRRQAAQTTELRTTEILHEIDNQQMLKRMEEKLDLIEANPQEAASCEATMIELRVALDKLEESLAWPILASEAEVTIEESRQLIQAKGSASDRQSFTLLEHEIRQALASHHTEILKQKVGELEHLRINLQIKTDQGRTMVTWFLHLKQQEPAMADQRLAKDLIAQGHHAMEANDLPMLEGIVFQLVRLLPKPLVRISSSGSTVGEK